MKKSILLIDDEEIILAGLGSVLRKNGYEVTTANSGEEGLEKFYDESLIITDFMMPGINGIDVLKKIKEKEPLTMVIIITGYGEINSAIEALRSGAIDYLIKPVQNEELLLRISNCFEQLEMQLKIRAYNNMISVCPDCKEIKDDSIGKNSDENWVEFDDFFKNHAELETSHGYCPECYSEVEKEIDMLKNSRLKTNNF